jgi:hypothetical protein
MRLGLLFEKYSFLKAFKPNMCYEETTVEEIHALLEIHSRLNEVESMVMDLNSKT